ncbi:MAG: ribosome maturation factor RimP [Candidatus Firestonebacteria bacterium]|nr:ribosome maturation factor RimP [Candidatus Firestonebacteria bacterium]
MAETDGVVLRAKEIADPILKTLGLELYDIEYKREYNGLVLRIYIDKPNAKVKVRDCQDVSKALGVVFEERNLIENNYNLEVSSPGLDRVLKLEKDFVRFAGYEAQIYFNELVEGKNNYRGLIKGVINGKVLFEVKGVVLEIPVANVKKGKLVF